MFRSNFTTYRSLGGSAYLAEALVGPAQLPVCKVRRNRESKQPTVQSVNPPERIQDTLSVI
jgi:hypothetical protein